jgi:curved DNA-binding protein CbpA
MVTLYEALGVREDASEDEIKRAYRKAAMRAHPDRNQGREAAAHDAFQEIKQAYAILSDPEQRRVYDTVFAQEMSKLREHEEREARRARERAEREAQAQRERYEKYVALAMRYAERGHNRDVVFGVLLGRGADEALAARIADGVAAFAAEKTRGDRHDTAPGSPSAVPAPAPAEEEPLGHAGLFTALWHGMFGLRS